MYLTGVSCIWYRACADIAEQNSTIETECKARLSFRRSTPYVWEPIHISGIFGLLSSKCLLKHLCRLPDIRSINDRSVFARNYLQSNVSLSEILLLENFSSNYSFPEVEKKAFMAWLTTFWPLKIKWSPTKSCDRLLIRELLVLNELEQPRWLHSEDY